MLKMCITKKKTLSRHRTQDSGLKIQDSGSRAQDSRLRRERGRGKREEGRGIPLSLLSPPFSLLSFLCLAFCAFPIAGSICCGKKPSISLSDMVRIPAGSFLMGSSDEEIKKVVRDLGGGELGPDVQWFAAEKPQHEVYLKEFYIDKYEVTNAQYKEFVQATGRPTPRHWEGGSYPDGKADHPVVYVSWEDANAYCRWFGKRLPTEAEWEKAARGTDARIWPWGNTFDIAKCNVESWEGSGSTPVGSYPDGVSPYGVYDMAGNVWEWTDSWYDAYPGSTYTTTEFGEKLRVLRGGSWYHYDSLGPIGARCASRDRGTPQHVSYVAGFRCAISGDEVETAR